MQCYPSGPLIAILDVVLWLGSSLFSPTTFPIHPHSRGPYPRPTASRLDKDSRMLILFHDTNHHLRSKDIPFSSLDISPELQTHRIHRIHNWSPSLGYHQVPETLRIQNQISILSFLPPQQPASLSSVSHLCKCKDGWLFFVQVKNLGVIQNSHLSLRYPIQSIAEA